MDWDKLFFNSANLQSSSNPRGFELREGTNYWYSSTKQIHNGFLEVAWQALPSLMIQAGLRLDHAQMDVEYRQNDQLMNESDIKKLYLLPSLNIKHDVAPEHTLRYSISRTYTMPQVKEISPYQYVNIGFTSQGSPDLKPSDLWNVDFKWDWYISPSELLTVNLFYKDIAHPIARFNEYNSANVLKYVNPAEKSQVAGVELEVRKNIFAITNLSGAMHKLQLGLSGSYIYSNILLDIQADESRRARLEGATPWLCNADVTYSWQKDEQKLSCTLLMNYFSDTIHTYGSEGIVNKGIRHDLIEKGRLQMNGVVSYSPTSHLSLKVKANNLLDQPYCRTQMSNTAKPGVDTPELISQYYKGRSFSLGVSYTF